MIPLSAEDTVRYTDTDMTTFLFVPKTARLEYRLLGLYEQVTTATKTRRKLAASQQLRIFGDFADSILVGCEGYGMDELGSSVKPSSVCNSYEIMRIIGMWHTACRLTAEDRKHLIVGILMQYSPHKGLFRCSLCGSNDKKVRGCKRNRRKPILNIPCTCQGGVSHCEVCKGTGSFPLYRCPVKVMEQSNVTYLLSLFYHWKNTGYNQYPDGGSIIDQPLALREAFMTMQNVAIERENEEMELARKKSEE